MTALGHTHSIPWHISEALKGVLSGKSIEEEQYMFLKWLGMQSEWFVFFK
jgi:hypothetical protein